MRRLLLPFALLSLGFAPAPFLAPSKPGGDDLKRMQGIWACVSLITDGGTHDLTKSRITATVKGDRMCFGSPSDTWQMKFDWTSSPRRVDFHRVKKTGTNLLTGVYKLEGDKLTICWRLSKDRPVNFSPTQPGVWVYVFQRKR